MQRGIWNNGEPRNKNEYPRSSRKLAEQLSRRLAVDLATAADGNLGNEDDPLRDFVVADSLAQELLERDLRELFVTARNRGPRHFRIPPASPRPARRNSSPQGG